MDKKRLDIMVDIETLGKEQNSTIIAIAAIAFSFASEDVDINYYKFADISKGLVNVDGDTLKWWLNTDSELLKKIINSEDALSPAKLVEDFHDWLKTLCDEYDVYLWGNGILFDNKILKGNMCHYGFEYPVFYRNDRDMRTIVDLAIGLNPNVKMDYIEFVKANSLPGLQLHDPRNDVLNQIHLIKIAYNMIYKK